MKSIFRKTLPLLLAFQLISTGVSQQSNATILGLGLIVGAPHLVVPLIIIGFPMFVTGEVITRKLKNKGPARGNWQIIHAIGIILDEDAPSSHEIDFEKVTPESLSIAYDEKTANALWNELKALEKALEGLEFKFEFPKPMMDFVRAETPCNRACRERLKYSEREFLDKVATTFNDAAKNTTRNEINVSPLTTRYLIEQMTGYTFLSTDKEFSN